jgi:GYF domain 2
MDLRQLVRAFDAGRIDADTLVWRKGMPDWRRLRDVSELAERLIGGSELGDVSGSNIGDSNIGRRENTGKVALEPPPADLGQSGSEPPPRQSERSRTPPASYTVGSRSGSEPPAAAGPGVSTAASKSAPPPAPTAADAERPRAFISDDGGASLDESGRAIASSRVAGSRSGPSSAPRPHSRRGRGKPPSRPNGASLTPARTVTQTGLESPAEVVARNSLVPLTSGGLSPVGPAANGATPVEGGEGAHASVAPGGTVGASGSSASRTRDSRTSAPPGGVRRKSSSDETPAQKPSSLSVPPGAMTGSPSRPRGRWLLAMAAAVLGAVIVVRQLATSGDGAASTAQHRVDAVTDAKPGAEPKQVENALAPEPKAAGSAEGAAHLARPVADKEEAVHAEASQEPARRVDAPPPPPPRLNVEASASERIAGSGQTPAGSAEAPSSGAPSKGVVATPPGGNGQAASGAAPNSPALSGAGASGVAPSKPVSNAPVATSSAAPSTPRPMPPTPPVHSAAAARPAVPGGAPGNAVPAIPRAPRPFEESLATQQFAAAADRAASCNQAGPTRGSGRIKVAIEPWGRVGRVTHLNQDFVGTSVGVCVTDAFQQIKVPPFDGNSRAIVGDFNVQ